MSELCLLSLQQGGLWHVYIYFYVNSGKIYRKTVSPSSQCVKDLYYCYYLYPIFVCAKRSILDVCSSRLLPFNLWDKLLCHCYFFLIFIYHYFESRIVLCPVQMSIYFSYFKYSICLLFYPTSPYSFYFGLSTTLKGSWTSFSYFVQLSELGMWYCFDSEVFVFIKWL